MTHTESNSAEAHGTHANRPNYLAVFIGLALLTAIEVGITYLGVPDLLVTISLLAFMAFKVVLVAMFYMHLKMDSKWFSYLFLIPIPFVILIVAALFFTNHRPIVP